MTSLASQLEARLRAAVAERQDHKSLIGIHAAQVAAGMKFSWRDALTKQHGCLCVCSELQLSEITLKALAVMAELRSAPSLTPAAPPKKRPSLDRKALRMMKQDGARAFGRAA